ncbi:hypothetical protein LEP1GSC035_2707 [Leptospira noguchii str. 2007001578]|uniref:Uncharacterized protein n=1 Tax=Leptospira noguchii str. 2007001578 TaxID=1049974 RepID=A0ABP2TF35_9LEPT|nr:hypothetical protein LEP1GSC035_2707 [Leptospira noguchii str. 2007001578]
MEKIDIENTVSDFIKVYYKLLKNTLSLFKILNSKIFFK